MRSPLEIIAGLSMMDGMIEDLDKGDARVIIEALDREGWAIVPKSQTDYGGYLPKSVIRGR